MKTGIFLFLFWVVVAVTSIAAYVTHILTCFQNDQWGFLIAGAIAAPVAVIHGFWVWAQ